MCSLVKRTEELFEELDGVMNLYLEQMGISSSIKNMDDEELLAFGKCMKLMAISKDYSMEMAAKLDKIDSIESKLDKLLAKKN